MRCCYLHLLIDATILARVPFREKFARSCFETLLQFSFLHSQDSPGSNIQCRLGGGEVVTPLPIHMKCHPSGTNYCPCPTPTDYHAHKLRGKSSYGRLLNFYSFTYVHCQCATSPVKPRTPPPPPPPPPNSRILDLGLARTPTLVCVDVCMWICVCRGRGCGGVRRNKSTCIRATKVMSLSWSPDPTSQLALNALLERCKEVLAKFVHEERLSGQCPLPR